jgi:hypothetical protein
MSLNHSYSERLTSVAIAKGRDPRTSNHENAANKNGGLSTKGIGTIGSNEIRDDRTDAVHVDQDTELVLVLVLWEKLLPLVHLLGRIDHHAVETSGCRPNQEEDAEEVELAKMRLPVPSDLFESRNLGLGDIEIVLNVGLGGAFGAQGGDSDHFA